MKDFHLHCSSLFPAAYMVACTSFRNLSCLLYTSTGIANPILWSTSFVLPNSLRAAGDSRFTSISSMLSMWLFRVVLGYVLGIILPFGIVGVWCAMLFEWGVRSLVFLLRFKSGRWARHKLI